eukprot:4740426-Prymnesium_polylepis.1
MSAMYVCSHPPRYGIYCTHLFPPLADAALGLGTNVPPRHLHFPTTGNAAIRPHRAHCRARGC